MPNEKTWPGPITAITLFAEDLAATKAFYLEVFGLPVYYEDEASAVFKFGSTLSTCSRSAKRRASSSPAR
jgi:predicted enzyme related to lactoylglutathione lyase